MSANNISIMHDSVENSLCFGDWMLTVANVIRASIFILFLLNAHNILCVSVKGLVHLL